MTHHVQARRCHNHVSRHVSSACSVCQPCPAGTYQDVTGSITCKLCPAGTYNPLTGVASLSGCLPVPKGNYGQGAGSDVYFPCEGGTYQDQDGQTSCKVSGSDRQAGRVAAMP